LPLHDCHHPGACGSNSPAFFGPHKSGTEDYSRPLWSRTRRAGPLGNPIFESASEICSPGYPKCARRAHLGHLGRQTSDALPKFEAPQGPARRSLPHDRHRNRLCSRCLSGQKKTRASLSHSKVNNPNQLLQVRAIMQSRNPAMFPTSAGDAISVSFRGHVYVSHLAGRALSMRNLFLGATVQLGAEANVLAHQCLCIDQTGK
jgi:hypothetical protein